MLQSLISWKISTRKHSMIASQDRMMRVLKAKGLGKENRARPTITPTAREPNRRGRPISRLGLAGGGEGGLSVAMGHAIRSDIRP